MTKAFISYHHANDQWAKEHLSWMAQVYGCFEDVSVNTGDISDDAGRSSQSIRVQIRDNYLKDSEVTILLCGTDTKGRKHVDWELKSSMIDGSVNKKSGILVVNLPGVNHGNFYKSMPNEDQVIYPDYSVGSWVTLKTRNDYQALYPHLPDRIIDNLYSDAVYISVVPWDRITSNPASLKWLVDQSAAHGRINQYDLTRPMRRKNSPLTLGGILTQRFDAL